MRARPALIALLVPLVVASCGEPEAKRGALRVDVVSASADGDLPTEGWRLVAENGSLLSCAIESRRLGHLVIVANGPAGRYDIRAPKGLGIVDIGAKALSPDLIPVTAFAGREHTLYLTPRTSDWHAVDAIVAAAGQSSRTENELASSRETGTDGRLAIRIAVSSWDAVEEVIVTGVLEPTAGTKSGLGGRFATVTGIRLPRSGAPTGVIVEPDSPLPFLVRVLPIHAGDAVARIPVRMRVSLARLVVEHEATVGTEGVARFDELPVPVRGSETAIEAGSGLRSSRDVTSLREAGEARVFGAAAAEGDAIDLPWELAVVPASVQVRLASGPSYGHLPAVRGAGLDRGHDFVAPEGARSVYVRFGDRAAMATRTDPASSLGPLVFEPLCAIQGSIAGSIGTARPLDLFARRLEEGKPVEAEGWVLRRRVTREFELMLPAGEWRLTAEDASGKAGPITTLSLDRPGTRANVKVAAPP